MATLKPVRLLAAATVLAGVPLLSVSAQTPPPPSPTSPPAATKPDTRQCRRPARPRGLPIRPRSRPWRRARATSPRPPRRKVNPLVGLGGFLI